jgi:hypothetical protein
MKKIKFKTPCVNLAKNTLKQRGCLVSAGRVLLRKINGTRQSWYSKLL